MVNYGHCINYRIDVQSPAEAKSFSLACVHTGSGAHPTMGTGRHFPGAKARPWYEAHLHLVPR
jgi:hypothetical protein